jgi:hypothetical protein
MALEEPTIQKKDFDALLRKAENYRAFALETLEKARGGNPDAQFALSEALFYCDDKFKYYFTRGKRRLTLDEALQSMSTRAPVAMDDVRISYARCHDLQEQPVDGIGTSSDWLKAATAAGHPRAQARTATFDLMKSELASVQAYQGVKTGVNPDEQRSAAIDLLKQALKSKDPSVLWSVSDLRDIITGNASDAQTDQWVWRLAACKRGYDCSETSVWRQQFCGYDQGTQCFSGETGVDLIRRVTGVSYQEVERRADEIARQVGAGDWDSLNATLVGSTAQSSR